MTIELRGQIEKEREKVKKLTARLLMKFDGDHGVGQYLSLSSEAWATPVEGVKQNLCVLSTVQDRVSVSNIIMEPGSSIPIHRHENHETIFVIDGQVIESVSGRRLRSGEAVMIPAGQDHGTSTEDGALLTVCWRPSLEAEVHEGHSPTIEPPV